MAQTVSRPRQLTDLRLPPTATDPRPLFIPSAEAPRDNGESLQTFLYPRLLWTPEGVEFTVYDADEHQRHVAAGALEIAPQSVPKDPLGDVRDELAGLSTDDREVVLAEQRKLRREALMRKLAALSDDDLEAVTTLQARGPKVGRPRKA